MKREKARLEELRRMPYEEYRQTPEWQETQKGALKKAGNRCQVCRAGNVSLNTYHTTLDTIGCEQEGDVMTLCLACYDRLYQQLVGQEDVTSEAEGETSPHFSFTKKAIIFTPAAFVGLGLPALLHAPLPAELFGLGAAIALAINSPKIYAEMRGSLPEPVIEFLDGMAERKRARAAAGEWSKWDRLIGRHMHDQAEPDTDEEQNSEQENASEGDLLGEPVFPRYRDDETLSIGQAIDKAALAILVAAYERDKKSYPNVRVPGRRFEPHIDSLFGLGVIISAVQGSGKSMLCGLIIEQAAACDSPAIVLDHKGEYTGIAELSYLSGIIAGGPTATRKAQQKGVPFFELTPNNVDEFVRKVISEHLQAIVSLPSYGDRWIDRATIVAEIGQALMRYSTEQTQQDQLNLPCLVLIDEAQLYIPENNRFLPPEARQNANILNNLSNSFFNLVTNGRSNGYTMCFATQSLTFIAKWAIKSCQIKVLMRHVENNDLETCEKEIGSNKAVATREDIEALPPGVGVVFGFTRKPMLVRFDKRISRDESQTPGVERLRAATITATTATIRELPTTRQESDTLQNLDVESITTWYTSGKIDQDLFIRLVKTVTQPETKPGTSGNTPETAPESRAHTQERGVFPVSTKNTASVSESGNGGNSNDNTMETALQANSGRVITGLFPASTSEAETAIASSEFEKLGVSMETIKHIKKMKEANFSDRDISEIVELRGRRYETYKKVLTTLGYRERA
jgi:hypothetical protein